MNSRTIRVRFAPSPTGFMHLGNVRSALINFLFARKEQGTFILRIEDTDQARNVDPGAQQIMHDLAWLDLFYDEGPIKGGPFAPYYQSERQAIYQQELKKCIELELVYRCFCSAETLEKKRLRQLALKQPPRYDRACLNLSKEAREANLAAGMPFIWRFQLNYVKTVTFYDLAHKTMHFELKHFSDVPLTREDGTFTFIFANFVDDVQMKISHVFRGEDHLANTAVQVALYEAFSYQVPVFWHLPIMCNTLGKKLSKRDFGFSLTDLRKSGFLPEAINNYLAIIGQSVSEEIMPMQQLINSLDFEHQTASGQIRYDVDKLRWVNHQWILRTDIKQLTELCKPYLLESYPEFEKFTPAELEKLILLAQPELVTLADISASLSFIVQRPELPSLSAEQSIYAEAIAALLAQKPATGEVLMQSLDTLAKEKGLKKKELYTLIRQALTGKTQGPSMHELLNTLSIDEIKARLEKLIGH